MPCMLVKYEQNNNDLQLPKVKILSFSLLHLHNVHSRVKSGEIWRPILDGQILYVESDEQCLLGIAVC